MELFKAWPGKAIKSRDRGLHMKMDSKLSQFNKDGGFVKFVEIAFSAFLGAVLVLLLWTYADANINHYTAKMDSDIASETLLGPLMYENGFVQPDTWIGSTHRYLIYPSNLASLLYPLTGFNMNLSMGIACTVMMLIMTVLFVVYLKQIGFSFVAALSAVIISFTLMRSSDDIQSMLFVYAAYYVIHFITLLVLLIFYNHALKKGKVPVWVIVLTLALAVVNGVQGMHACLFCYMPLLGVEILRVLVAAVKKRCRKTTVQADEQASAGTEVGDRRENASAEGGVRGENASAEGGVRGVVATKDGMLQEFAILLWLFVISIVALVSTRFTGAADLGTSRNIRHAGEKFAEYVWPFFLDVISFGKMSVLVAIFCVLAFIGYIFAVKKILAGASGLLSTFVFLIGTVVFMLSTTFTTAEAAPRYYVEILFVVGIGVGLFIDAVSGRAGAATAARSSEDENGGGLACGSLAAKLARACAAVAVKPARICVVVVAGLVLVYGIGKTSLFYNDLVKDDNSVEHTTAKIAAWMQENGYEYGYSTFDYANNITVVSNNKVKVRAVNSMEECYGAKWLSDKTWYPPSKDSDGPTCYIVSEVNAEDFSHFLVYSGAYTVDSVEIDGFKVYVLDHDYTEWVD